MAIVCQRQNRAAAWRHIEFERLQLNPAAVIRAGQCIEARFGGDKSDGVACADGTAENVAGVGIQPAWNIQCQHGTGKCIDAGNQVSIFAVDRTRQADSEQAVNDQPETSLRHRIVHDDAIINAAAVGNTRVCRERCCVPGKMHYYGFSASMQFACQHKGIATVVAGPRAHQYRGVRCTEILCGACGCATGKLHQRERAGGGDAVVLRLDFSEFSDF